MKDAPRISWVSPPISTCLPLFLSFLACAPTYYVYIHIHTHIYTYIHIYSPASSAAALTPCLKPPKAEKEQTRILAPVCPVREPGILERHCSRFAVRFELKVGPEGGRDAVTFDGQHRGPGERARPTRPAREELRKRVERVESATNWLTN